MWTNVSFIEYISYFCCLITCDYLKILQDWTKSLSLSKVHSDMNSEFSFSLNGCHVKAKESSLLYYLPIAEKRGEIFIPFSRAFERR